MYSQALWINHLNKFFMLCYSLQKLSDWLKKKRKISLDEQSVILLTTCYSSLLLVIALSSQSFAIFLAWSS